MQQEISLVAEGAPAERRSLQPGCILYILRNIGCQHDRAADGTAGYDAHDLFEKGQKARVYRFHNENIQRGSQREQALRLRGSERDRRFTQYRLARFYTESHLGGVFRCRRRDVDHFDLIVCEHGLHRIISLFKTVFPAERNGAVEVPRYDRVRPHCGGSIQHNRHFRRHKACSNHCHVMPA